MNKIKVSELFYSLQGEGGFLGVPSIFLRVFGCNFTCGGYSMPRGQISQERLDVDPKKYTEYKKLPLVHTGCDSYASWDVRFKHLSPMLTIDQIVDKMQQLLPEGKFSRDKHLILTGGEPLLGWQKMYIPLLNEIKLRDMDLSHITFETNGTQKLTDDLKDYLQEYHVTFSISSKLPSSGESWTNAFKPESIKTYDVGDFWSDGYFKWVVSSPDDLSDVQNAVKEYNKAGINIPIYLMPAGGTTKFYESNEKWVAEMAMKHGWRYSPRLQVDLWRNQWGT